MKSSSTLALVSEDGKVVLLAEVVVHFQWEVVVSSFKISLEFQQSVVVSSWTISSLVTLGDIYFADGIGMLELTELPRVEKKYSQGFILLAENIMGCCEDQVRGKEDSASKPHLQFIIHHQQRTNYFVR